MGATRVKRLPYYAKFQLDAATMNVEDALRELRPMLEQVDSPELLRKMAAVIDQLHQANNCIKNVPVEIEKRGRS